jgi:Kef-type K+ transport system membrane component KefB
MTVATALPLVLMALAAFAAPALARRLGAPSAVVEIALGVVLGRSGLDLVGADAEPYLRFLADVGFAVLLFLAGLEVDFRLLRAVRWRILLPIGGALTSFAIALAFGLLQGWSAWTALALSATSVPLLVSITREMGIGRTPMGQRMLITAATGEVVTILLVAIAEVTHHARDAMSFAVGVVRLVGLALVIHLGVRVLRAALWWFPEIFAPIAAGIDTSEGTVRGGFALMFVMIGVALAAGIEPLLGAFFGGLMLAAVLGERHRLEEKLASMGYGFLVPIFFLHVGMRLSVGVDLLVRERVFLAEAVALMLGTKVLPQLVELARGRGIREVLGTGLLLAAPLTLVIAIADLGARTGALTRDAESVLVVAAILASILFPTLARLVLRRQDRPQALSTSTPG